ncbi:MAG: type II toxin-antitoxin system prevent-host-death family antitoxin [Microcystis aeruginosa W13-11]|jgi:prevent-host-death family protein|nr:type II toxin-antitoxin system prevent-host-death family antitoxin [Microcystis aeruginosa W13-11]
METIDINQALLQIKKLLEIASSGEEIIITQNNEPMVKLVSMSRVQKPTSSIDKTICLSNNLDKNLQNVIEQSAEQDQQLTPQERVQKWLAFVQTFPSQSANLPDESLHRDTMYD